MAIEAPISKYKRDNIKIFIIALLIFAVWFGYDGYFNKKFIDDHMVESKEIGSIEKKADDTLEFNRKAPPVLFGAIVLLAGYLYIIKDIKIVAGENELILNKGRKISYDSIQKVNKTFFGSKGYFIITYKDDTGKEADCKLTSKKYDNLSAVLDHLIAKIS